MKQKGLWCLLILLVLFSCKKEKPFSNPDQLSSGKDILTFSFLQKDNPGITQDLNGEIKNDTIKFTMPQSWSKQLLPHITVSDKAIVGGGPIVKKDFSTPVHYTVVAEDNSTKDYVVVVSQIQPPKLAQLIINNAVCPYDSASNTFYFPVSIGSQLNSYTINFDTLTAKTVDIKNQQFSNGGSVNIALKTNDTLTISANDGFNNVAKYNLLITGLPLVKLIGDPNVGDDYKPAGFSIIDPDFQTHGGNFYMTADCGIKIRGASSAYYPKKSMAVQMHDSNGDNLDTSVLGLRSDQNWILDAMWIDKAKMRNRLCTDVWNTMNNVPYIAKEPDALNGTRGYLAEVFFNNEYHGVYMLTEKLDRKQLKVKKKTGFVYKADQWGAAVQFTGVSSYNNSSETWAGWEVSYPDANDDYPINWSFLYNTVKFVSSSNNTDFTNQVSQYVDMDNMVDYLLFVNAVCGQDNTAKNTFLSIYDTTKSKQMFYSVWDLDGSMGRDWAGNYYQNGSFLFMCIQNSNPNHLYERLMSLDPGGFIAKLKARWAALKTNQLSIATVTARIQHYRDQLVNSNVYERESARWPAEPIVDFTTETNYMSSWYAAHFQALDNYINNL